MINVTDTIKKAYEESTTQYDKIVLDGQEYYINNAQYEDDCYYEGNIFGTAIARTLEFEIEDSIDLEKKEFEYLTGVKTENGIEWINLGNFITQDLEPNDTTGINKVTAMDYMLKSNIEYTTELNYESGEVTILQVLQEACQEAGLTLATTDFANASFIVDSNQFDEGILIRQVFQAVAQISGTFAKIRNDNKLYFITPKYSGLKVKDIHKMKVKDLNSIPVNKLIGCKNEFKMNDYSELILKRNTHPINLVSLGMSDVEGENVIKRDEESIEKDGENSLIINDNPFAYTEEKRHQLISALFNTVKGFEYTAYEITGQAKPYQETGDEVVVIDKDGTFTHSFLFRFNFKSPNGLESEMSAPSITKATIEYQNIESAEQIAKKTELRVDKQEQTITGIITQQTETSEKLTEVKQTVDGITQTVSSVETKVEQVENKADNAQTTADTANQNAQNAQQTANNATNQITTTNQKVSQIEQTVNNITQSVTEVEEKIETVEETANTANSTANQAKSTAETANNTANTAKNTADTVSDNLEANYFTKTETSSEIEQKANSITQEVTETVENIQIGGTNLIKDSAPYELNNEIWQKTSSKVSLNIIDETSAPSLKAFNIGATGTITDNLTGIYSIPTCNVLQKDKEYCYSMWLKASENCTITVGYPRGGRTNLNVTTNWTRHTFKFKATEPTASSHGFGIYLPQNANTSFKLYAHSIKLEEGNKITAWSPAPEDDVKGYELGTRIEQNVDAVKLAWNQISEYIQMMILNGNASLAILDSSNNVIMALDKEGQNFYKNGETEPFGEMGIKKVNNQNYISFSVLGEYGQSLQDGMAWGITIKDDNKFIPILYIKDFEVGPKNSETGVGKLVLSSCDIVLDAMGGGIEADGIKIHGDGLPGLWFDDVDSGKTLLCIKPDMGSISYATISILDTISFYANQAGSNSFKIGNDNSKYCLMTDDGSFQANSIYMTGNNDGNTINLSGQVTFGNLPTYQGDKLVYGKSPHSYFMEWHDRLDFWVDTTNVGTLSDKRLKTEIKDIDEDFIKAIEEIEMKQFKVANRNGLISFGILAQDLIEIFKRYNKNPFDYEIVYETRYRTDDDTIYYAIDYTQFLILKQKAMDMKLKKLEEENKAKDKLLQELISRIEKIEGGNK